MKKFIKLICITALLFTPFQSTQASTAEYPELVIRAATANPQGSIHVETIDKFKEIIERESNGKITVQTFYGGSLGDEQANVKQLRNTEIHLSVLAGGNLTPFSSSATVYFLPYLFPKIEDAKKLLSDKKYNKDLADRVAKESSARPLAWLIGGYRLLTNSKKPIETMADLKQMKIRVPAVEIQLDAFRSWGVEPHPLAWSETFNALQQGVADGQENPHSINRDQKFWEVQKYITNLHYMLWVGPVLVSERWYRKLDPQTKALVDSAAQEAAQHAWKWSEEQEAIALQDCIDNGMIVNDLDDEEVWAKAARGIWPKYYDKIGGKEQLDKALAIINQ